MQQGLLCNDMGLHGMGQQPGHGQLPYGHADLDPSLAASMANLGLQGSLMDGLQGSHWQVGAHIFCRMPCFTWPEGGHAKTATSLQSEHCSSSCCNGVLQSLCGSRALHLAAGPSLRCQHVSESWAEAECWCVAGPSTLCQIFFASYAMM